MSAEAKTEKVGRRDFLKFAGVSAASGGVALAVGGSEAEAASRDPKTSTGYTESDHVKTYYKLAAF